MKPRVLFIISIAILLSSAVFAEGDYGARGWHDAGSNHTEDYRDRAGNSQGRKVGPGAGPRFNRGRRVGPRQDNKSDFVKGEGDNNRGRRLGPRHDYKSGYGGGQGNCGCGTSNARGGSGGVESGDSEDASSITRKGGPGHDRGRRVGPRADNKTDIAEEPKSNRGRRVGPRVNNKTRSEKEPRFNRGRRVGPRFYHEAGPIKGSEDDNGRHVGSRVSNKANPGTNRGSCASGKCGRDTVAKRVKPRSSGSKLQ